ncbi:MAG TPA: DUF222 domain-containing protein [Mycobacteriales bacterium]|nr:DUF222 domain-containing protein [Mycobacteriales bacterium]
MHADPIVAVEAFLAVDVAVLDEDRLQEVALVARRLAGRLVGLADKALGQLEARGPVLANRGSEGPPSYRPVQGWWRDAAGLTGQQAGRDLRRAAVLRDLPVIGAAVVDGVLAPEQAAVLTRLHGRISGEGLQQSQRHLVEVSRPMDTEALGRLVSHLVATHCEPALESDDRSAHHKRYLQLRADADGTVRGRFVLTAEDAEAVQTVLEPLARQLGSEDSRSAGQRRADALVEVCAGAAAWMDLPDAGGQRPSLSYVVTGEWCAGEQPSSLPERLVAAADGGLHALALSRFAPEGAWTGPQTRARIESVLCDARISRLLVDSKGEVLSLQSLTGHITRAQRRAVSARDHHCIAKGCTRPPAFCDVHHLVHLEHGGSTSVDNLVLLCRRHHVLWHKGLLKRHDLHLPWLTAEDDDETLAHDPWRTHSPPLVA